MNSHNCIADDVKLGTNVRLSKFINMYGCEIGDETKIGAFVEIQKNASVGKRCKISSHTFICEGVAIEDNVFIGHGVMFINDSYPRATGLEGNLQTEADWKVERTVTGRWNALLSRTAPPSALAPRYSPTRTLARTRLWVRAALSQKMYPRTPSWPEIRPESYVTSNQL